ncbi:hypothetical protein ACQKPX_08760 [Photobacterium sp. DNB23_23_1]|uniref:Uncharacterized protein n=1 Tax=Photobacterium pectinilyticum TaxID=2906793 RepID=A0ABT1N1B0_9GAMM|nr:hypothetical protein [Photobacterium sp. ZSDE20]MCQ1057054.1 hypothetical protein [Photobacterium sp. ZSDE20]MDD1821189.1 hypothetical protein [Photobacterium sp. ZSDE20]
MDVTRRGLLLAAKGLAVLVMICLVRYADSFALIFSLNQVGIVPSYIAILVLLSGVGAILGLGRGNRWGFIPLYFFIPAITMFFNYSIIPYLPQLFSPEFRGMAIFFLNSSVLVFSVLLLLKMMDNDVIFSIEKY